jgi:hypothetical protein
MQKQLIAVLVACIGMSSSTLAGAGLFSAKRAVIAIVADELYVGEAEGYLSGAGTLSIHSQKRPELLCVGDFTSSAKLGGQGQLQCNDGATATFQFKRLTTYTGYGTGIFSRGAMSFAYGLTHEEVGPYLQMPAGKILRQSGTELALADL